MAGVLYYCREGFEKDLANEVQDKASQQQLFGYPKLVPDSGYMAFECFEEAHAAELIKLPFAQLIFARQHFCYHQHLQQMDTSDRITPIVDACEGFPLCGEIRVEHPDTTQGREISKFCRKITVPLRQALRRQGLLTKKDNPAKPVLHVFFTDNQTAYVGYSLSNNNSPFQLGILRLKFPHDAPSRSTLKLDEAFQIFVPEGQSEGRIEGGSHAVDLGACPGGWTYQLVQRGMFVQAVDNGAMDDKLMNTGMVQAFAADGFKFEPKKKNIAWLVCDMIEQPQRVAKLISRWIRDDWCRESIFNLKLPMKKRYESVQECLQIIDEVLGSYQKGYDIQIKHLYHDREEVTVHLRKRR